MINDLEDLSDIALKLQRRNKLDEAVGKWRALLLLYPDYVQGYNNLGIALRRLGRIAESEAVLRSGLERDPKRVELHLALAKTLLEWGRREEGRDHLVKIDKQIKKSAELNYALGMMDWEDNDLKAAMTRFTRALKHNGNHVSALIYKGMGHRLLGEIDQALIMFRKAARYDSQNPMLQAQLADTLILAGNPEEGWPLREWRFRTEKKAWLEPNLKPWDGSDLKDQTLLLRLDSGLSEAFMMLRLTKYLDRDKILLQAPLKLRELLWGSGFAYDVYDIEDELVFKKADCWASVGSLPALLKLDYSTLHETIPYMRVDPTRLSPWRKKLGVDINIGVVWDGGIENFTNRARRVPPGFFKPLGEIPGVKLISLQVGEDYVAEAEQASMNQYSEILDKDSGFMDTLALLEIVDLVVTVSGPIAHLAGALGRPTWVLLPTDPGPLYALEDIHPWYPNMRLFRRMPDAPWQEVMERITHTIQSYITSDGHEDEVKSDKKSARNESAKAKKKDNDDKKV